MKKLLLLTLFGFSQLTSAQIIFQENWDGIGPGIAGWTLNNVDGLTPNAGVNFVNAAWVSTTEEFGNNVAMSNSWYTPAGTSNDWLISPAIVLPAGTKTLSWDARTYDPTYKDSYKVFISTTGNSVANFTTQLFAQGNGTTGSTGENTTWTRRTLDLSSYTGTIYIAFQNFSTDMFLLAVDNISITGNSTCQSPNRVMTTNAIGLTTATLNWDAVTGATGYEVAVGAVGFIPSTQTGTSPTNSYVVTNLTPNNRYQYYVRNSCGSMWIGPYNIFTASYVTNSNYGFETTAANGGYNADGWTGSFSLNNTAGAAFYADGVQMVFSNSSTTAATDRWLYSRPIYLTANEQITLKFSTRSTSTTVANSLISKVGSAPTPVGQTTTLSTVNVVGTTFVVTTNNFTAPTTGTYYFGFNHNNPATSVATSIVLDKVEFTTNLNSNDFLSNNLVVYPNPTKNIINISNSLNAVVDNVVLTDLNGRVVKSQKINATEGQVDISDLATGIYMMNVTTDQGVATKKVIKE
ncbi:T9SS-dependent choice-of-anchor J family protein [Flavobacterium capsici]|uniref:Choice-of-anchor J domain-containing protein n=1 Tax=Flavobacterium capsici TaxID=3075618 RepID=A0AA96F5H9_9FLAO|nr:MULTISPECIES: choice-of-anchor J domain-containing protein [unclassified Flavobacterium]WNM17919.1 choice-of-anchor J domain-containing protein [Flavobacterium sp. PMR2A8]WNM21971.1 choice-of-anchor J domain-containing protein [Flavobacterium sp. PMTSA4]